MPLDEIVRRAPFALYGLPAGWTGRRAVHSAGLVLGEVTHTALSHHADDARLVVDTLFGEERAPSDAAFHAALHLDAGDPRWRPWPIEVEGREQVFWRSDVGDRWAAFARVGGLRVVVAATRWDPGDVRLAVVDRERYLAGSESTSNR